MPQKDKYKRLLVIDFNVTEGSPTMRGWLDAFESFVDCFDEVEIWAANCALAEHPRVKFVPFRKFKISVIQTFCFYFAVKQKIKKTKIWPPKDTLVQVTSFVEDQVHIRYLHFSSMLLLEERKKRANHLKLNFLKRLFIEYYAWQESLMLGRSKNTQELWVVSRKLGEKIHQKDNDLGNKSRLRILPNAYNPDIYNGRVRLKYRDQMRKAYGFTDDEIVFVFSAYSHFERKGLLHAVEAIAISREKGAPFRLIVFGGGGSSIADFKKKLKEKSIASDGITFAGLVEDMHQHLSVGEALLFPSHFEAFSLAEIEAAAMGLRLYLTPHYGTEMILRESINGKFITWEANQIANTLIEEWKSGQLGNFHNETGEALTGEQYAKKLREFYLSMQNAE